ncbi:MAG TPA: tetratricopeptide repeat protein, partial [Candidatus Bathyarchaeia archaeon]|nr:tetratricopeptide repeat protein [Candidatus Bathyarchaeia archaeon]
MKKFVTGLLTLTMAVGIASVASAYNFGDYRSSTLASKGWESLAAGDLEAVLAYTNKCLELYANNARKMQETLTDYPQGTNDEIFAFWALNDAATSVYIQGEAYRKAGMMDEAKAAYNRVINEFKYGQCWDVGGWFWKPAEAAAEKIAMIETGSTVDYGDFSSSTLAAKAWNALAANDLEGVKAYVAKNLQLYEEKARQMQESLTEYPWESNEKIFEYWALNDVGTSLFVLGDAYRKAGQVEKAKEAFQRLVNEFYYAQCWDNGGWFWKPAEAAQG